MYEFDQIRLLALAGACYGKLNMTAAAERTLREALEALGLERTRRRAEVLIDLAVVRAQQQDANEAAGLAGEALPIAVESGSVASVHRVQRFRPELARWDRTPAVMALDEQLDGARRPIAGAGIICVRERRGGPDDLVVVPVDGSAPPRTVHGGHDFYAFPRPSLDGRRLAWVSWDHPNQPWCGTDLWAANLLGAGMEVQLGPARHIAGGHDESVTQSEWGPDGTLHFVSDRCGWWNLYRERDKRVRRPGASAAAIHLHQALPARDRRPARVHRCRPHHQPRGGHAALDRS